MNEESKKIEPTEQEAKASELSEESLDKVAGGGFDYQLLPSIKLGPIPHMDDPDPPLKPLKGI